eukprot:3436779-Amphidinium_carterae.1
MHSAASSVTDDLKFNSYLGTIGLKFFRDITSKAIHQLDMCGLERISKGLKTAYTARLAVVGIDKADSEVADLMITNKNALVELSREAYDGAEKWYSIISTWTDNDAMNFGTIWNLMPSPDADTYTAFERATAAMNAPKTYDQMKIDKFKQWFRTNISGRVVAANAERKWDWHEKISEADKRWVEKIESGTYVPAPAGCAASATGGLRWEKEIETRHFRAKDVTRIDNDIGMYPRHPRKPLVVSSSWRNNELLTALHEGRMMSGYSQ